MTTKYVDHFFPDGLLTFYTYLQVLSFVQGTFSFKEYSQFDYLSDIWSGDIEYKN